MKDDDKVKLTVLDVRVQEAERALRGIRKAHFRLRETAVVSRQVYDASPVLRSELTRVVTLLACTGRVRRRR